MAQNNATNMSVKLNQSWTPTIVGSGTAGAGTYSVQVGRFSQLGDIVFANFNLTWSAHTGTGNMLLGGLPATVRNVTNQFWTSGGNYYSNITMAVLSTELCIYVQVNTTTANFFDVTPSAAATATVLDTAGTVTGTMIYSTATL